MIVYHVSLGADNIMQEFFLLLHHWRPLHTKGKSVDEKYTFTFSKWLRVCWLLIRVRIKEKLDLSDIISMV